MADINDKFDEEYTVESQLKNRQSKELHGWYNPVQQRDLNILATFACLMKGNRQKQNDLCVLFKTK